LKPEFSDMFKSPGAWHASGFWRCCFRVLQASCSCAMGAKWLCGFILCTPTRGVFSLLL